METQGEVTKLLVASSEGDRTAFDALFPLIYGELHRMAHRRMQRERPGHTLSTTALVHEAYLKLVAIDRIEWKGKAHFFAIAAQAMRNILVTYATRRKALKRGGGRPAVPLDDAVVMSEQQAEEILALDEALHHLARLNERQHQVVECRFFGGLSIEETAQVLGISPATVKRDWNLARAYLNRALRHDEQPEP